MFLAPDLIRKKRVLYLWAGVTLTIGLLILRLMTIQIGHGPEYARRAFAQRTWFVDVELSRGLIYDRHLTPLTDPEPRHNLAVFPSPVRNNAKAARLLSPLIGLPEEELNRRLSDQAGVWLAQGLSPDAAETVRKLEIPGVLVVTQSVRYGPGSLARHLVGYIKPSENRGQLGLEGTYDDRLRGERPGRVIAFHDAYGRVIPGLGVRTAKPPGKEPLDLILTIDGRIQRLAEESLDRAAVERGAAVVLNPRTGEVLAMASRPNYDQGAWAKNPASLGGSFLVNRAVSAYPPGSVFKIVTAAAALEEGVTSLDEEFFCRGFYQLGQQIYRCYRSDSGGHGKLTFKEALAQSSNPVFVEIGVERLGGEKLREYARRFGFGEVSSLRLWNEDPGSLPELGERDPLGEVALMSFGQGKLTATPVQIAQALAIVANDGVRVPLKIVDKVRRQNGQVIWKAPRATGTRVIERRTARLLQEALEAATGPGGTGRQANFPGVRVAGKTGSAEKRNSDGSTTTHAWFAGYFPADRPEYVIVILVEDGGSGGGRAAPIFREIGEGIMKLR